MALRCLLFSSDEATAAPITHVLTELGVEAEHCSNPVDAVERVTTQSFQIVITDWKDQPEAAFLLKTARDLKAAARPLTLAIVNEESRPHALQAGANSVLLKPLRPEQVRDTMSTACQLLQSKLQTASPATAKTSWQSGTPTAPGASGAAAAAAPAFTAQAPEKLRAGEFLQAAGSTPGLQFDTESDVHDAMEVSSAPVDSLTELEPMASAVQVVPEPKTKPEPKEALTGWAALQARLVKSRPVPVKDEGSKNELTSYQGSSTDAQTSVESELESFPSQPAKRLEATAHAAIAPKEEPAASRASHELEVQGEDTQIAEARPRRKYGKAFVIALVLVSAALVAIPRTRETLKALSRTGSGEALRWLNPPPPPMPQTVTQHDSFGQADDEYKLPAATNIPDSTTDPSKIEVVPVIDPTAKPDKSAAANAAQAQAVSGTGSPSTANDQPAGTSGSSAITEQNASASTPNSQNPSVGTPAGNPVINAPTNSPASSGTTAPATTNSVGPPSQSAPAQVASPQQPEPATQSTQQQTGQIHAVPVHTSPTSQVSASQLAGIPSSLKSQVGSTTPDMSGPKPDDSASSIEPVTLPESTVRGLLVQGADPQYPDGAKAGGLQGSVTLQVLIGADGAVQDAKFMQGSFVFARTAIDAVKQWHFKPYSMRGRAVSVQSVITLNFKPPA